MAAILSPSEKIEVRRAVKHFYATIGDITITYGDIVEEGPVERLPVYVERPDGDGDFDFAEGITPACTFQRTRGFSEFELQGLSSLLQRNLLLLWEDAREKAGEAS